MSKLLIKLCLLILVFCLLYLISPAVQGHEYDFPEQRLLERIQMVNTITGYRDPGTRVHDPQVLNALRKVPRHKFVPKKRRAYAYANAPVDIGYGQTISQPYIVALMTQLADIEPDMAVLEIGTGSGYQAAILAELTAHVYTMEIISPLAKRTKALFNSLSLKGIHMKQGDGYYGWPEAMQFDRILVTAAAAHIPAPLLKQLKPGGRMVIPVGPVWGSQELLLVSKDGVGRSITRSILPVRFVPLTGNRNRQ